MLPIPPFKPLKVGIIGCGVTSGAYLSRLKKYPILELAACSDLEVYRAEARAEQYKIPRVYTVDELLADKKIQIVLNLTPGAVHPRLNQSILEAGKHLYTERPLTLSVDHGTQLLTDATTRKLLIGCAPDTFLGGGLQTCRHLIDSGIIGEPLAATAFMASSGPETWHPAPETFYQTGGGPLMDTGHFYLGALIALLGPISRVCASVRKSRAERLITGPHRTGVTFPAQVPTHCSGIVDFQTGVVATVVQSFDVSGHHLPAMEIYGTEGTLGLPDPTCYDGPVTFQKSGSAEWESIDLTHSRDVGRGIGLVDLACAITHHRPHRCNEQYALHLLEALLAFETSSSTGMHVTIQSPYQRPTPLPRGLPPGQLDPESKVA